MYDVYRRQQQKYPGRSMTKNMLATVGIGGAAGAAAGYGLGRTIYNKRSQKFLSALSNARKEQLFQLADRSPEQKAFLKATRAMMNQAKNEPNKSHLPVRWVTGQQGLRWEQLVFMPAKRCWTPDS